MENVQTSQIHSSQEELRSKLESVKKLEKRFRVEIRLFRSIIAFSSIVGGALLIPSLFNSVSSTTLLDSISWKAIGVLLGGLLGFMAFWLSQRKRYK